MRTPLATVSQMNAANSAGSSVDGLGPSRGTGLDRPAFPVPEFGDFYRKNFSRIVMAVMHGSYGTSLADAQDLAQDAFVIALERWELISRLEYSVAYVAKTAVRLAQRRQRRADRMIVVSDVADLPWASPADLADLLAEWIAGGDMAEKMIAQLPERQAATIRLLMDGATTEEIGLVLNVQPATVRSNLRFARVVLKALLDQQDDGPTARFSGGRKLTHQPEDGYPLPC
jgi:RNA polymerase sigma-70 factor, ECF subfamily